MEGGVAALVLLASFAGEIENTVMSSSSGASCVATWMGPITRNVRFSN